MTWKQARISVGLSTLFMLIYGSLNWVTEFRPGVASFHFGFERRIPFVPAMILPYLSIDIFYILGPFVCRSDRQCKTLVRRLLFGLLVGALCFALVPLKFGFARPEATGFLGWAFDRFRELDAPYNQLPSLHIVNIMVLTPVFLSFGNRWWKGFIAVWFSLICASTVLTYQHHLVDAFGGMLLGAICFYVFPDDESADTSLSFSGLSNVGMCYAFGTAMLVLLAFVLRPFGWILLWPAMSLLIVTIGYAGVGPAIFHKHRGRLSPATWLLLWPVLIGQRISLAYYRRQCNAWDRLTDHLWIGRMLSATEAKLAIAQGVSAVIDLTGEFSEAKPFLQLDYLQLPVLDLIAPSESQLRCAIDFINAAPGVVYVHCKIGYSRTAAIAGAYLISAGIARDSVHAVAILRQARPSIIIRPEALAIIESRV
jgi:membrane-associated phospholipid phosphatase